MLFSYCCFSILFYSILRFQYTNINSFIKIYWYVFSWLVCLFVCLYCTINYPGSCGWHDLTIANETVA